MPATYEPIATTTLGSAASSYTFSSIPQTYSDLKLVAMIARGTAGSGWYPTINCNGNTTTGNYGYQLMHAIQNTSTSLVSNSTVNIDRVYLTEYDPGGADQWGLMIVDFINYTSTSVQKGMITQWANPVNSSFGQTTRGGGNFFSTGAISSITVTGLNYNLAANSKLTLFGIKRA